MRFAAVLTAALALHAAADGADVRVGLLGTARLGNWTPISVSGVDGESVVAVAADPFGDEVSYPLRREGDAFVGEALFGRVGAPLVIEADGVEVFQRPAGELVEFVPERRPVWLTDGGSPLLERGADRIGRSDAEAAPVVRIVEDQVDLSPGGAEVLLLTRPAEDVTGVLEWVRGGGHLVASSGGPADGWEALLVDAPIRFGAVRRYGELNALSAGVPASRRIRVRSPITGAEIDGGRAVVDSRQGPVVSRAAYGFGRITLVSPDLTAKPLVEWDSLSLLAMVLTDAEVEPPAGRKSRRLARTGVTEVQTQLLAGVEDAGAARPIWRLLSMLIGYGAVVGFVDFLLIRYVLRRPQWTWATLGLWVVGSCVLVAGADDATGPAEAAASLTDFDATTGTVRGRRWRSVAPPDGVARRDLAAEDAGWPGDRRFGWVAPPETNFGGLYRPAGLSRTPLRYAADAGRSTLVGVPFLPGQRRSFETTWSGDAAAAAEADLRRDGSRLVGRIVSRLDFPVADWVLAFDSTLLMPAGGDRLLPGEAFNLTPASVRQTTLREGITGVRLDEYSEKQGDDLQTRSRAVREPYDPASLDLARVVRIATFFRAAGGRQYAGVSASRPRGLDLTPLLGLGRAVLVGRLEDGEGGRRFVRLVLPIIRGTEGPAAAPESTP